MKLVQIHREISHLDDRLSGGAVGECESRGQGGRRRLGFGRIVDSEIEAPIMLGNLV